MAVNFYHVKSLPTFLNSNFILSQIFLFLFLFFVLLGFFNRGFLLLHLLHVLTIKTREVVRSILHWFYQLINVFILRLDSNLEWNWFYQSKQFLSPSLPSFVVIIGTWTPIKMAWISPDFFSYCSVYDRTISAFSYSMLASFFTLVVVSQSMLIG